ncbi:hypothetical protein Taro_015035 [Colocasia esculenta]|uniref:Uncharacterized protein n=1 Tax=Colocasia esculenta TaxID=4460 RepID=A0A843UJV2_COLES|nr:hypothetical protein [Colocasia esculenta]
MRNGLRKHQESRNREENSSCHQKGFLGGSERVLFGWMAKRRGRVEELLVAEELWNDHKKPFFFPFSSVATCTNHPLEVDQRVISMGRVEELLVAEELWNDHKKPFFFPFSSAVSCTNHPLEVDQRFYVENFV